MLGDQVLINSWYLINIAHGLWGSKEGGCHGTVLGRESREALPKCPIKLYLPVTVPTARTEPLGWKPAERAGS